MCRAPTVYPSLEEAYNCGDNGAGREDDARGAKGSGSSIHDDGTGGVGGSGLRATARRIDDDGGIDA